jgi:predicted ABC-type ATPase
MNEYIPLYQVYYLFGQDYVKDMETTDKEKAIEQMNTLRQKGLKYVHIQYSFNSGGITPKEIVDLELDHLIEDSQYNKPKVQTFADGGVPISMLKGKEIELKMPNGEVRKGQFAIVELSDIKASHNENTFSSTEGYPVDKQGDNINDRNYKDDVNAQQKVREFAQNLEADRLITTSRTPSGTPIIIPSGIVVSGNNRTMSIKLALQEYPDKYKEYQDFLIEECEAFGFIKRDRVYSETTKSYKITFSNKGNSTMTFNVPVLVRIDYDIPELNTLELSKYNKDTKKSERPIDKAIKLGKMLQGNQRCKDIIGEIVGNFETFSDFYADRNAQKQLFETLISCNILTDQERPLYFSETGFTDNGKDLMENILVGIVLSKEALLDLNESVKKYRAMLVTSLPVLSLNSTLGEFSLIEELNQAIIIEAKIVNSKLGFKDWVRQKNMFEDKPSKNILSMNRFLSVGRNTFKQSIEKYNISAKDNQENMLFGEPATKQEIFNKFVVEQLSPEDIGLINQTDKTSVTETPIKEIKMERNAFANGNFFKTNPDKILASQGQSTDRYKKPITTYKGTIDNLDRIEVNYDILTMVRDDNPVLTNIQTPVSQLTDKATNEIDNLTTAIEKSPKDASAKRKRQKKMDEPLVTATSETDKLETYTLAEMFDMANPEVSIEEVQVFLWYSMKRKKPVTNPAWYDIAEISMADIEAKEQSLLKNWAKKGLVFYDGSTNYGYASAFWDQFVPTYVYLSGNVYDKYNRVVKNEMSENTGKDAELIITNLGQDVYELQVAEIRKVFKAKYDKRLIISSSDQNSVTILPNSKFAKSIKINTLVDETPFKWKKITAGSNKRYGQPDFLATNVWDRDKSEFPELSLRDAFALWIVSDKTVSVKQGITYADIINYYVYFKPKPKTSAEKEYDGTYSPASKKIIAEENAIFERLRSKAKGEGDRLFNEFLDKQLTLNDRVRIETQWNMQFNNNVPMNYNKIPVAFQMNKFSNGQPLDLRAEKREAVAFTVSNGSGLLAYDVGVGKTPSAIFTMSAFLDYGFAKRPLVVVPNQTYKQWINEFKSFAGHIRINKMYNLNDNVIEEFQDTNGTTMLMAEGSVTIMTYEGLLKLGFNETTQTSLGQELMSILMQDTSGMKDKKAERTILKANTKAQELVGKALAKSKVNVEDFGFDYICLDEAHACKKVFTNVVGEAEENTGSSNTESRPIVQYKISAGIPSSTAIKGFALCQYIQKNNKGNTQLLTATPFTNSPLEIYSMLAMIGYERLTILGLNNLNTFFDTFVDVSYELVINTALNPERKQVILGFNNLIVMQQLVRQFINHKTGESVGVQRPNKWVLPMTKKKVDDILMPLPIEEQVNTALKLSPEQARYMAQIKEYAEGKITKAQLESMSGGMGNSEDEDESTTEGVELDEDTLNDDEKVGVRLLLSLNHARNLALSPYLYEFNTLGRPTSQSYIDTSGKIKYVMECIRTIKQHHEQTKTAMGGVVIYMERGVRYFDLIREYLIESLGFKPHEVGIISSNQKLPVDKGISDEEAKEHVKNLFLGKKFNKATLEEEPIPDEQRVKVLIGSATIREGINLQEYSSTLFNCFLSFNPTDVQQLEGRIYRQKNAFANVRIVNPIMIDSADIFMFQKLEEKTSRINSVFETDGTTNVLKTEEFNPQELKYSLVKDAKVLAKMEVMEETEKMSEQISDLQNDMKKLDSIGEYESYIKNWTTEINEIVEEYRPSAKDKNIEGKILAIQNLYKTHLDEQGKYMLSYFEKRYNNVKDLLPKGKELSDIDRPSKSGFFDNFVLSFRNLKRLEKDYLNPRGFKSSQVAEIKKDVEAQIEKIKENQKTLTSDEAITLRANAITIKRQEMAITEKSLDQVVADFKRLNYLLDDVKVKQATKVIKQQCPPLDEQGQVRIDAEGLRLLQDCADAFPKTKFSHGKTIKLPDGSEIFEYKPERLKLHQKIINEITQSAVCIDQTEPIAVIMGGAPGSGKSTFLKKNAPYMQSDKIWKIDADEVRAKLPEYKGWNSSATHEETQDIVKELLDEFDQPCKHDLLYDGTMSNIKKYNPVIKRLKKLGYKVFLVFMDIPKDESIKRALNRFKDNNGGEAEYGRFVPISVIDDFFRTGDTGFQQLKKEVDGYIKIDSLSQKVVERGGITIPENRPYYRITKDEPVKAKEVQKETVSLNDLKEIIAGAKITIKYLIGKEKQEMKEYISGLEITIKYM